MYPDQIFKRYQDEIETMSSIQLLFLTAVGSAWHSFHVVLSLEILSGLHLLGAFCMWPLYIKMATKSKFLKTQ